MKQMQLQYLFQTRHLLAERNHVPVFLLSYAMQDCPLNMKKELPYQISFSSAHH